MRGGEIVGRAVDWTAIKTAYVTSTKSYRTIAKEFGMSFGGVSQKGREDGWPALRKAYQEEAACRAIANEVDNEANRLGKIIEAANSMSDVIHDVFADADQFHRHIVQDKNGDDISTVERRFEKVDSRAIKDLTGALKDMTLVLRNLYNLPTQAEAEAQRIAAERLNLDKRKADMDNSADKTIKVVLADGWEELSQ